MVSVLLWRLTCLAFGMPSLTTSSGLAPWEEALELGHVEFATSAKSSVAQAHFIIGLKALHSFWYSLAIEEFQKAIDDEGEGGFPVASAMQAFASKMMLWNYEDCKAAWKSLDAIDPKRLEEVSWREQLYVGAVRMLFTKPCDSSDSYSREVAFTHAFGKISDKYPDDIDALGFYGLGFFSQTQQPQFGPEGAKFKDGIKMLDTVRDLLQKAYDKMPKHPGTLHYLIHAHDSPGCTFAGVDPTEKEMLPMGIKAAVEYPLYCKSAPHALHMPSHIWIRVGNWTMSEQSNFASVEAGRAYLKNRNLSFNQGVTMDVYHAMEYLQNDYLQQGKIEMAASVLEGMNNLVDESFIKYGSQHDNSMFYLNLQYRMHARFIYESRDYTRALGFWGKSIPRPLISEDMADGQFFWASLSEGAALVVTAISKLFEQMVDNSGRDMYYRSITMKEVKYVESRMKKIADNAASRKHLMPYVKQALRVFETETYSMSAIADEVRCPDADEPCPTFQTHIPYTRFEERIVPELEKATKIQDGMQELPSTPSLLLIPSYEWYGLALMQCAGADKPLQGKRAYWKCSDVSEQQRKDLLARAEKQFRKSLDRRVGRLVSIFNLGLALEAQGKVEEAQDIYNTFLKSTEGTRGDIRQFHAKEYVSAVAEKKTPTTSALFALTNFVQVFPDKSIAPAVCFALLVVASIACVTGLVLRKRRVSYAGVESLAREEEEGLAEAH